MNNTGQQKEQFCFMNKDLVGFLFFDVLSRRTGNIISASSIYHLQLKLSLGDERLLQILKLTLKRIPGLFTNFW